MERARVVLASVAMLTWGSSSFAQSGARVDFGRDIQPILREHCISCHGPSQQLNGFRLDRRSAALRGGTFPVIAPGSSAASRLYLKLLGTSQQFGGQMPPTGKLSDEEIGLIKRWLDEGAEWPDSLAGETASAPVVREASRIMEALRGGDRAAFARTLKAGGANEVGAAGGWTPLMYAALYGDAAAVRSLLGAGAKPNAVTDSGTSALMLAAADAEKTRLLLDAGANPNVRPDDGRTPLIIAASRVGSPPVVKLLLDHGADPKAVTAARTTALRQAAAVGEVESMRLLIQAGADLKADAAGALTASLGVGCRPCAELVIDAVDRRGLGTSMIALARLGDLESVKWLLDRGADVNATDGNGRTALMQAANTDNYPVDVVRLLLARGADATIATPDGKTAGSFAAVRRGPLADLLSAAGATIPAKAADPSPARLANHTARAAVQKSVPLLQKADQTFLRKSGCVSCHNESLTAHTVALAERSGVLVDEAIMAAHRNRMPPYLDSWRESVLHGFGIPGSQDTVGYILYGLIAANVPADAATDAMAYYLKGLQLPDGHWRVAANRPPIEASSIEVTATCAYAIEAYAPPPMKAEYDRAVQAAARWLAAARPVSLEDRAFQILGLVWTHGDKATIGRLVQDLVREQRADGGWSPIAASGMTSDVYATGEALVALRESGVVPVTAAAYRKGADFLLATQLADGSWHVVTRAEPVQAYFDADFPHGRDQFISAAATNWATLALLPVITQPSTARSR